MYHPDVHTRDLPRLPRNIAVRIRKAIEERLMVNPALYGERLRKDLAGAWKIRVGDYRVVFDLDQPRRVVTIFVVAHRSDVYGVVPKRKGSPGSA